MLSPVALRLALVQWMPPPEPAVHDEFGHLLVADTLAAGRLANPPHPLWRQFETIYVLQQPTYSSCYPIGQGIVLAVGKVLFGAPWAGVLLGVALACGAIAWMLFGCLPPPWAATGAGLAAAFYGMDPTWIDSYWGGAFTAFGGGLFFGALCRFRKSHSPAMALLAGLGWSVIWLTRPFESVVPCLLAWGLFVAFCIHKPWQGKRRLAPMAAFLAVQGFAGGIAALHNHTVTGSFATFPYQLCQQAFGVPQSLLGQKPVEAPPFRYAEARAMYQWQLEYKLAANRRPARRLGVVLYKTWAFFATPWFTLPIALLAFQLNDRLVLFGGGIIACSIAASALYPFFFPHYLSAYSCIILFLILRGMMVLSRFSFGRLRLGMAAVLFCLLGGSTVGLRAVPLKQMLGLSDNPGQVGLRTQVAEKLRSLGNRHVVFVTYESDHSFHDEWVYNAADVDQAPIIWCRAGGPAEELDVIRYYSGRQFWMASVGRYSARLTRLAADGGALGSTTDASGEWSVELRRSAD